MGVEKHCNFKFTARVRRRFQILQILQPLRHKRQRYVTWRACLTTFQVTVFFCRFSRTSARSGVCFNSSPSDAPAINSSDAVKRSSVALWTQANQFSEWFVPSSGSRTCPSPVCDSLIIVRRSAQLKLSLAPVVVNSRDWKQKLVFVACLESTMFIGLDWLTHSLTVQYRL